MNYHMNKIDSTLLELLNILVIAKGTLKNLRGMIFTVERTPSKRKSTEKKKVKSTKKQKKESKPKKDSPKATEAKKKYFHYHAEGHWRRNYLKYLESLKIKKDDKPSEGMLVIESNLLLLVGYWTLARVLIYVSQYRV